MSHLNVLISFNYRIRSQTMKLRVLKSLSCDDGGYFLPDFEVYSCDKCNEMFD